MKDIKLLFNLQDNYNKLIISKKILKNGSYIYFLKKLKEEFDEAKIEFKKKEDNLNKIKEEFKEISSKIKYENKIIDNVEYQLYNQAGSNLKLIDKLQDDIEKSKNKIKHLEDLSFNLIEKEEKFLIEKNELLNKLRVLKVNFDEYKEETSQKINNAKNQINISKEEIIKLKNEVSKDSLKDFDKIRKNKGVAVVPVENEVCLGCKMKISKLTVDKLRNLKEIVHCDNCGRILYLREKHNEK